MSSSEVFLISKDGNKIPLNKGKTALGRGDLLGVQDKRVSRQQAEIEITFEDDKPVLTLTPNGLNPMYLSREGKMKELQLLKGREYILQDGDTFTLCVQDYPFKVEVPSLRSSGNHPAKIDPDDGSEEEIVKSDEEESHQLTKNKTNEKKDDLKSSNKNEDHHNEENESHHDSGTASGEPAKEANTIKETVDTPVTPQAKNNNVVDTPASSPGWLSKPKKPTGQASASTVTGVKNDNDISVSPNEDVNKSLNLSGSNGKKKRKIAMSEDEDDKEKVDEDSQNAYEKMIEREISAPKNEKKKNSDDR